MSENKTEMLSPEKPSMSRDEWEALSHCVIMLSHLADRLGQYELSDTFAKAVSPVLKRIKDAREARS